MNIPIVRSRNGFLLAKLYISPRDTTGVAKDKVSDYKIKLCPASSPLRCLVTARLHMAEPPASPAAMPVLSQRLT